MDSDHLILGYDAREMFQEHRSRAHDDCEFQLRNDVVRQLSTDDWVWPSIFDDGGPKYGYFDETDKTRLLPKPEWCGPVNSLWDDLTRLRVELSGAGARTPRPYWIITVTLSSPACSREDLQRWQSRGLEMIRPLTTEHCELLGYDVSDEWLLSGLSNCGNSTKTGVHEQLSKRFGPCLNAYHLFDALDTAIEFRDVSDERTEEHAPFFVYGLWLIERVNESAGAQ